MSSRTSREPGSAEPRARRLQAPSWRDPRLLVGVLIVSGSIIGVTHLVRASGHTVPVLAARHALLPGDELRADDVSVRRVRFDGGSTAYLQQQPLAAGQVVLRAVGPGELVPSAAVGGRDAVTLRPVTVPMDAESADGLQPGSLVDVWVAARDDARSGAFRRPRAVARNAQVSARVEQSHGLGAAGGVAVRLLLTPDLVPAVIEAVDNQARVTLVPVAATIERPQ